jgi:hypothetical protein
VHCALGEADAAALTPPAAADNEAAWAVDTVHIAAIITIATITSRPLDLAKIFFIYSPHGSA